MPVPVSASSSLPEQSAPEPQRPHWGNRLAICGILAMVLVPFSFGFLPREVARWYAAAATTAEWDGNYDLAQERLAQAIAWDAENPEWYLTRALLHEEHGEYAAALADCDALLELQPENIEALKIHSMMCIHLGKPDAAINDWKQFRSLAERDGTLHVSDYNDIAYFFALADRDLDEALVFINRALVNDPENYQLLDTRGYVYYRLNKYAEARRDLDKAVADAKSDLAKREHDIKTVITDPQRYQEVLHALRKPAAVIIHHRALVLEKLGLEAEAEIDRARVRELGFTPDEHLF